MQGERKKIMLVDDNITNLTVGKNVLSNKYDVFTLPSGEKLLNLLKKLIPDLILLDIEMPGMDGYETIKRIKADKTTKDIPVIFLTAKTDAWSELEGFSLGAIDYISKPFSPPLLSKRIEAHLLLESQKRILQDYNDNLLKMVKEKTRAVVELQNAILHTVADMVECRDEITGGHIERTQCYLKILLDEMLNRNIYADEMESWEIDFVLESAQLHDLGKISIKDSILLKQGKLTEDEFEEMKLHAVFGVRIIERIEQMTSSNEFLKYAKVFAGTHHEKWDGTGYPRGLKGNDIPLQGRLMAIVDVYDALISKRPYKEPLSYEEAEEIIKDGRGKHFDPQLTDLFLSIAGRFKEAGQSLSGSHILDTPEEGTLPGWKAESRKKVSHVSPAHCP
ncbi:response regulator [Treponema sp. OttesenSCG-928-L16]|nr:response regulator [Treponema sp. OttesenSCG-928-L16]